MLSFLDVPLLKIHAAYPFNAIATREKPEHATIIYGLWVNQTWHTTIDHKKRATN